MRRVVAVESFPTTPWYDDARDEWETGDPPRRTSHVFAEHMNTLAESGEGRVAETQYAGRRGGRRPGAAGLLDPTHKVNPPLSDDERDRFAAMVRCESFDAMYRATMREIRHERGAS